MSASRPAFQWDDALLLDSQLTEEERMVRDSARAYCQGKACRTTRNLRDQISMR